MNAGNVMKSNSYRRLVEHWRTALADNADPPSTILGIETKSVAGAFMTRKPVFSTAC
jgi:hypothetical protein